MKSFQEFIDEGTIAVCTSFDKNDKTCISGCMAIKVKDNDKCKWKGTPKNEDTDCPCYEPPVDESEAPSTTTGPSIANPDSPQGKLKKRKEKKCTEDEECGNETGSKKKESKQ
ncbi:MAG: hypothetical protein KAS32_23825 [Candidatus Peribacteraceae bacterium]|nr:hypothetical protein [Candidatus Peribacteraceae bacterium]